MSLQLFPVVQSNSEVGVSFVRTDAFSVRVTKKGASSSWTHSLPVWFWPLFNLIYQKDVNQINWKQNSLKLSFTNIRRHLSNFIGCESSLESNFELSSFNLKGFCYFFARSCSLFRGRTSFCTGIISKKFCSFLFMFYTRFTSFSVLRLFLLSITVFIFVHSF